MKKVSGLPTNDLLQCARIRLDTVEARATAKRVKAETAAAGEICHREARVGQRQEDVLRAPNLAARGVDLVHFLKVSTEACFGLF